MNNPSRNIPMRTVIVAAIVVERFAPRDRIDSEKRSLKALTPLAAFRSRPAEPGSAKG
jgi:hypothetical protein